MREAFTFLLIPKRTYRAGSPLSPFIFNRFFWCRNERTPSPGEEGVRLPFAELAQDCTSSFAKTPMLYLSEL
jgi:hypothetical protein